MSEACMQTDVKETEMSEACMQTDVNTVETEMQTEDTHWVFMMPDMLNKPMPYETVVPIPEGTTFVLIKHSYEYQVDAANQQLMNTQSILMMMTKNLVQVSFTTQSLLMMMTKNLVQVRFTRLSVPWPFSVSLIALR